MEATAIFVLSLLWASFAGMVAWQCGQIGRQVTYVTLADGRRQERRLPFLFRLLLPLAPNLTPYFARPSFDGAKKKFSRQIEAAGFAGLLNSGELLALRVLMPVVLGVFSVAALWLLITLVPGRPGAVLARQQGLLYLAVLLWCYAYPGLWLRRMLAERHKSIQRSLPFVLDLLTLSVEAGLDFMNAVQRIVNRGEMDAISEELVRVQREIQVGKTRRAALRDMAERVDQPDVRSVVSALVQADELGVGIASILRIQADQMRNRRFERAEKQANEAPVKMLFPLVVFIFPAVFLVLLGPIILQMLRLI